MDLATTWTLTACGLMAHADGVLDGEECDRITAMIEEEVGTDADAYAEWLAVVGDRASLEAKLASLELPPAEQHREILEQVWTLALVDGRRCEAELAMLESLARRLGVEPVQLEFWREAWSSAQEDLAETMAVAVAVVLGQGSLVPSADHPRVRELLSALPYPEDGREGLVARATRSADSSVAVQRLVAWPRRKRVWLLRSLADLVVRGARPERSAEAFVALAEAVGLDADKGRALLRAAERRR